MPHRIPRQIHRLVIIDTGPQIFGRGIERVEEEKAGEPEAFDSEE
jgi:hypothetical protein